MTVSRWLGLLLGSVALHAVPATAQMAVPAQVSTNLPAGPLARALARFTQATGIIVVADAALVRGRTSSAVRKGSTPADALRLLLRNTGLRALPDQRGGYTLHVETVSAPQARSAEAATGSHSRRHQARTVNMRTDGSDDIVVTGLKINKSLNDTTTAVSVVRGADPTANRSPYDAITGIPNVLVTAADLPSIRGVTGSGPGGGIFTLMSGARPRVATIIDGLPETFAGQRYADSGMWDVDQVEVLRGPQSTTQGWNSIGGAIVIRTADPTFDWRGKARIGYESEGEKGYYAAAVSGPLVADQLAIGLDAAAVRGHGYIDYPGSGWPYDPSDLKRTDLRGKLLLTPAAIPDLRVVVTGTHRKQEGEYLYIASGPDFFRYKFDNPNTNTRYANSTVNSISADASYRLSSNLSAHLLYGHGWFDAAFEQSNSAGENRGTLTLHENNNTAEARLVYDGGRRSNGVIGLYYYDRQQHLRSDLGVNGPDYLRNYAVYADTTIGLIGPLALLAGGRVEREEQKRNVSLSWGKVTADIGETLFLPKLGLSYAASPSTNLAVSVRRGYSPGGGAIDWDSGAYYQYGKETVTTYEFVTRTALPDHRLSFNTNLFYNRYQDYQGLINYTFVNIPRSRTYGAEVEASYRPWDGMEAHAGVGLLRSRIERAPLAYPGAEGTRLSNAPDFSASVGADQKLGSGLFVGGDVSHVSGYLPQVETGTSINGGNYWIAGAHVGYDARYFTVRAYVKNLANEHVLYGGRSNWAGTQAQVGQPRAFGVTLDGKF